MGRERGGERAGQGGTPHVACTAGTKGAHAAGLSVLHSISILRRPQAVPPARPHLRRRPRSTGCAAPCGPRWWPATCGCAPPPPRPHPSAVAVEGQGSKGSQAASHAAVFSVRRHVRQGATSAVQWAMREHRQAARRQVARFSGPAVLSGRQRSTTKLSHALPLPESRCRPPQAPPGCPPRCAAALAGCSPCGCGSAAWRALRGARARQEWSLTVRQDTAPDRSGRFLHTCPTQPPAPPPASLPAKLRGAHPPACGAPPRQTRTAWPASPQSTAPERSGGKQKGEQRVGLRHSPYQASTTTAAPQQPCKGSPPAAHLGAELVLGVLGPQQAALQDLG